MPEGATAQLYVSDPEKGGIVRVQSKEFIPYKDTKGFIVAPVKELELLIFQLEKAACPPK